MAWRFLGQADEAAVYAEEQRELAAGRFGVFDTEDNSKELLAAGRSGFAKRVTLIAGGTCEGRRYFRRGHCPDEFKKWLRREAGVRGVRRWYAHNLQYDLGNLFGDELDELEMVLVGGRLVRAVWHDVIFLDSFNLFPVKVATLGRALGMEKLAMNVRRRAYVDRDWQIVREALERLTTTCRRYGVRRPANTLGGLCVKLWQAMGGSNWPDHSAHTRGAIFGGRVELFSRGGRGHILWTDINSLYPWAMTQPFPQELTPVSKHLSRLRRFGITTVTVEVPEQDLAPLPYRVTEVDELTGVHDQAIIFPCGRFTGTWTNHELRAAVEHHQVKLVRVHQQWAADHGEHYYQAFVEEFYRLRLEQQDEAYRLIYKLLMNNLYGQLGMGGTITRTCALSDERAAAVRRGELEATVFGSAVLFDVRIPLPEHVNYAHAAYVTSYGRLRLLEFLRLIAPENRIYTDTDSLFFFHRPGTPLPFTCGSALGQMKLEGIGRRADVLAPKTYRLVARAESGRRFKAHPKAKGVPKSQAAHFLRTGWAEYDAPFKVREAIAFFDRGIDGYDTAGRPVYVDRPRANARRLSVWRTVRKELRSRYHKKKARRDGRFTPLILP